ncbi:MAG: DUF6588 family protein [Ignavibacteria bacterium]
MYSKLVFKPIFLLIIIFLSSPLKAQLELDLGSVLKGVGSEYAKKYLEPFTTGIGTNLNSGFVGGYNPAPYSKIPITPHLYAGVKFCGVVMEDKDKTFNLSYEDKTVLYGQTIPVTWQVYNAPTVFGSTEKAIAKATVKSPLTGRDTVISTQLIGGLGESKFVFLFIPQIGIGSILGTDLIFRSVPGVNVGNYGSFKLFGWALRHNIGAYASLPFDLAFQFGYQKFGIKDKDDNKIINANSFFGNVQLNKTFLIVSIYMAAQYEYYNVDVNYTYTPTIGSPMTIAFSQKGDNNFRAIVGGALLLGPVKFNADVNFGAKFTITTGLGLGL